MQSSALMSLALKTALLGKELGKCLPPVQFNAANVVSDEI